MKCRKCSSELDESNIKTSLSEHGEELVDLIIECPECEHMINDFVPVSDFIDID